MGTRLHPVSSFPPHPRSIRRTRVEIDLLALRRNFALARSLARPAEVLAVVKADAYGHGAIPVARALEAEGAAWLGVALVEEGLSLREAGVRAPILVLGGAYDDGWEAMVEAELTPVVFRPDHLARLSKAASGREISAHLKVDTGMGRIGVRMDGLDGFLEAARDFPNVKLDGVLSHFANADLADADLTREQVRGASLAVEKMRAAGQAPRWRHLSNSAGVLSLPEARDGAIFDLVRPGLMLYGASPAHWLPHSDALEPVLSWKTEVLHLKRVPKGTPISYGSTWVAPRESVIATLPVGYADGWSRAFSNRARVLVRGKRAPIVGRVCMDLCMADVTEIAEAALGDEVVLLGRQGDEEVSADALAEIAGTIPYEIFCGISARVPRVFSGT